MRFLKRKNGKAPINFQDLPDNEKRVVLLSHFARHFATQVAAVLSEAKVPGVVSSQWQLAPRYIAVGCKLKYPTQFKKAIGLANSVGLATGLGEGSPHLPVIAVPLGNLLYFQCQLPRQAKSVSLWETITRDHSSVNGLTIGLGVGGWPVRFSWEMAPHAVVTGMTGSGKTDLVRSILMSLLRRYSIEDLGLIVIDPKRDFEDFENEAHLKVSIAHRPDEIASAVGFYHQELLRRQIKNIRDAQRWLLVLDEADKQFVLGEPENQRKVLDVALDGRTFGMNLLIASHKNDSSLGGIQEQLDNRYHGKVDRAATSGQIWAGVSLHKLSGAGDFLQVVGGRTVRFQGALVLPHHYRDLERGPVPLVSELPTEPLYEVVSNGKSPHRPKIRPDPKALPTTSSMAQVR